jgi:acyl carrier protein
MSPLEEAIRQIIVDRLGIAAAPEQIPADASLFAPAHAGGLELDSLASLEIIAATSDRFQLPLDDIEPSDVESISTLADYLRRHGVDSVEQHRPSGRVA